MCDFTKETWGLLDRYESCTWSKQIRTCTYKVELQWLSTMEHADTKEKLAPRSERSTMDQAPYPYHQHEQYSVN